MTTPDLFWAPARGDLVRLKPERRTGIRAFDEFPLRVKKVSQVSGNTIYHCETTGPVTTRKSPAGWILKEHPCWTGFHFLDELLPVEPEKAQR